MIRPARLLEELQAYEPADGAEERHRLRMVSLLTVEGDPFSRGHFLPGHFTASVFIVDDAKRLLLHHHRRLDRWLQMGGHVEMDEMPHAAALREGAEESGLPDLQLVGEAIFDLDVHGIPAGKGEPDHDHFDVRYVAHTRSPERIVLDRSESKQLAWVTLEQAAQLMPGDESQRVFRKLQQRSQH